MSKSNNSKNDKCAICFEELTEDVMILSECKHSFHFECLCEYRKYDRHIKCPLCRAELSDEDEECISSECDDDYDSSDDDSSDDDESDDDSSDDESDDDESDDESDDDEESFVVLSVTFERNLRDLIQSYFDNYQKIPALKMSIHDILMLQSLIPNKQTNSFEFKLFKSSVEFYQDLDSECLTVWVYSDIDAKYGHCASYCDNFNKSDLRADPTMFVERVCHEIIRASLDIDID